MKQAAIRLAGLWGDRRRKGVETLLMMASLAGLAVHRFLRVDEKGWPLAFVPTPGQSHYVQRFRPLMRIVADRIDALLTDKGYDADAIRENLADAKIEAVIPAKPTDTPLPLTTEQSTAGATVSSHCSIS